MAPVLIVAILTLRSAAAREQVIERLANIHNYSLLNEVGVVKHCSTVPRDPHDVKSLYIIEEYDSQAALDLHVASPAVRALGRWFEAYTSLFEDPTQFFTLQPFCGFTRNGDDPAARQPVVRLGTLQYQDASAAEKAKRRWKEIAALTERNEERGTLSYRVVAEKDSGNVLRTVEVFSNGNVAENAELDVLDGRRWATMLDLEVVGGYLGREAPVKALL